MTDLWQWQWSSPSAAGAPDWCAASSESLAVTQLSLARQAPSPILTENDFIALTAVKARALHISRNFRMLTSLDGPVSTEVSRRWGTLQHTSARFSASSAGSCKPSICTCNIPILQAVCTGHGSIIRMIKCEMQDYQIISQTVAYIEGSRLIQRNARGVGDHLHPYLPIKSRPNYVITVATNWGGPGVSAVQASKRVV